MAEPYVYSCFDFRLRSEIRLSELTPAEEADDGPVVDVRLGEVPEVLPDPSEQLNRIKSVRWAVAASARRVPWRAKCIEQGFAAQWMLRRRAVPAVLHYGIAKRDGSLAAHVWVRSGPNDVVGCENSAEFAEVAQFPPLLPH